MTSAASSGASEAAVAGFRWGHVNINVTDLERSVAFYEKLGFEPYLPGIPYLGLDNAPDYTRLPGQTAAGLGLAPGATGRACIMQLGKDGGYPKLDLTEFHSVRSESGEGGMPPQSSADLGLVRLCLLVPDVAAIHAQLVGEGVEFVSGPVAGDRDLATLATCRDPDGALIELLEIDRARWATLMADTPGPR